MASPASASPPKGLSISPETAVSAVDAGGHKTANITVANYTSSLLDVNLSVKQFTVSNYSYTYSFTSPDNNWVSLGSSQIVLVPGASKLISYNIAVPVGSQPGGNYYAFFASAALVSGNLHSTIQAASLLYLTVNGKLTNGSKLLSSSIQRLMFGSQITYRFNMIDTGNNFFFINVSGKLHGLTAQPSVPTVTHLVIPGKVRQLTGIIPNPVLPGIYRATYGYTTEAGNIVQQSRFIFYIPLWFIALIFILLLAANIWYVKKK